MDPTIISILKYNALPAAALSVVIYLQTGTSGDIRDLRDEMVASDQSLRADIQALRAETAEGFQEIRADMADEFKAVRAEMAQSNQSIRADVSALGERMARVETRLSGVERALYADPEPPTQ